LARGEAIEFLMWPANGPGNSMGLAPSVIDTWSALTVTSLVARRAMRRTLAEEQDQEARDPVRWVVAIVVQQRSGQSPPVFVVGGHGTG
jgi:hypothetical protein